MVSKKKRLALFVYLLFTTIHITAQTIVADKQIQYKVINGDSLHLHVFEPETSKKQTAAIVFFFGGGWSNGSPKQFYQQSNYLASRGILAVCAEYRINKKHGTTPFESVEDGKSAIRWLRQHAKELNIDPNKIVAAGGSAGGHIALCTALIIGFENSNEAIISSMPNAVIAYNPVLDTTEKGYGAKKVTGRETEISPCHQVKKNMPPMLVFHGKEDKTVPYENAVRFNSLMQLAGNTSKLISYDNVGHGFFNGNFFRKNNDNTYFNKTMYETDLFLKKMNYIKGKPTIKNE